MLSVFYLSLIIFCVQRNVLSKNSNIAFKNNPWKSDFIDHSDDVQDIIHHNIDIIPSF